MTAKYVNSLPDTIKVGPYNFKVRKFYTTPCDSSNLHNKK